MYSWCSLSRKFQLYSTLPPMGSLSKKPISQLAGISCCAVQCPILPFLWQQNIWGYDSFSSRLSSCCSVQPVHSCWVGRCSRQRMTWFSSSTLWNHCVPDTLAQWDEQPLTGNVAFPEASWLIFHKFWATPIIAVWKFNHTGCLFLPLT